MKLLIGSGDTLSRQRIIQTLGSTSLEISCVANGTQVWDWLAQNGPPRLLILDSALAGLDALEICTRVRHTAAEDYTYIILLSEYNHRGDKLVAFEAGADDYIAKPLHQYELLAKVQVARRYLDKEDRLTSMVKGWRAMLDNLPFGVACLSRNGIVLRANRIFAEFLGHDVKALVGNSLFPDHLRRTADIGKLRESIRMARCFDAVGMQFTRKDGVAVIAEVWGRPLNVGEIVYQIITANA
jgi:PAS domain S-box-containing protein